ncbi:G2/mitotic-specific cyclin-B3 [Cephus cinctus]|uniref:G2/mitotic-specific cyclin-B3 n=1 Tax=Cephus cinctus TaxID=211228 RepID=A0AAJ7W6X6_CEPCN|nr:G2/mitotic-specific cyclin-B3 [Cephus cinctus]XP_024946658.1 G2/mitotic-specific cyclin-B3 [Cephus cinctus]XP_024946659.1 G2/mitotic-specific cyclin-B3 [Cephus cinctus]
MAPTKVLNNQNKQNGNGIVPQKRITTRSHNALLNQATKQAVLTKDPRIKRKADASPPKEKTTKRSALGNITNAIGKTLGGQLHDNKKGVKKASQITHVKPVPQTNTVRTLDKIVIKPEAVLPGKLRLAPRAKPVKKDEEKPEISSKIVNLRRSLDLEKSEDSSLYVSALEEVPEDSAKKSTKLSDKVTEKSDVSKEKNEKDTEETFKLAETSPEPTSSIAARLDAVPDRELPSGVQWDFDAENWSDPYQVSQYAMEIFNYLKSRESLFPIGDYMERQVCLSRWMRSLLVDWMVEVQESFELNHETLYLAVKLVDLYLTKVTVGKETLQLLGAASLFIASKFDERIPPMVEDFLYICDGAYTRRELIRMEMNVLKIVDFDLGIPLSYRFLRRYARCAKVSMPTLTLARYILEYSLMDYSTIMFSDSKMAAAALLLALQMKDLGGWTSTLEYYTGFTVDDIRDIVNVLNQGLHRKHKDALATVRNKYSHKIFFEVAKVPLKEVLDI